MQAEPGDLPICRMNQIPEREPAGMRALQPTPAPSPERITGRDACATLGTESALKSGTGILPVKGTAKGHSPGLGAHRFSQTNPLR